MEVGQGQVGMLQKNLTSEDYQEFKKQLFFCPIQCLQDKLILYQFPPAFTCVKTAPQQFKSPDLFWNSTEDEKHMENQYQSAILVSASSFSRWQQSLATKREITLNCWACRNRKQFRFLQRGIFTKRTVKPKEVVQTPFLEGSKIRKNLSDLACPCSLSCSKEKIELSDPLRPVTIQIFLRFFPLSSDFQVSLPLTPPQGRN